MNAQKLFTITLDKSKWGMFDRVPLNLPFSVNGKRLKPSARELVEKFFSFTKTKDDVKSGCRVTYSQLQAEYGRGRSTVASALDELRTCELIKRIDRDVDGTEYVYDGERAGGKYYLIPLYLRTVEVTVRGERRKLTDAEVHVLALMMNECGSPLNGGTPSKGGGFYRTSYKKLARILHYATSTVRRAVDALLKSRLISRPKRYKGVNGNKLSGYTVKSALYIYKKYVKKARTPEEENKIRGEYYAELREYEKTRAEKYMAIARQNKEFCQNQALLGRIEFDLAKSELYEPKKVPAIVRAKKNALRERKVILNNIGLTLEDIFEQCNCPICKDTGRVRRENGNVEWCSCYPGGAL